MYFKRNPLDTPTVLADAPWASEAHNADALWASEAHNADQPASSFFVKL